MKYLLTLQNGEIREITILDKPVFSCIISGNASTVYKTREEIVEFTNRNELESVNFKDIFTLYCSGLGVILDEGVLFEMYKKLRNPIVKLERIEK